MDQVKQEIVIGKKAAHFGEKIYTTLEEDLDVAVSNKETKRPQVVATAFTQNTCQNYATIRVKSINRHSYLQCSVILQTRQIEKGKAQ